MNVSEFLAKLRDGRAEWNALLSSIDEARMIEPGVEGLWSLKDVIAHVTWFEREMIGLLQARALAGSELWELSPDERNAAIFEENRRRTLDDVLDEARQTYPQLLREVESLSDEDLNDARRFRDMPEEWQPWDVIAGNSYDHYRQHITAIRAWLEQF